MPPAHGPRVCAQLKLQWLEGLVPARPGESGLMERLLTFMPVFLGPQPSALPVGLELPPLLNVRWRNQV